MALGERIKDLRKLNKMTQTDLANELNSRFNLNVDRVMISKWETGFQTPVMYNISCIAKIFGVSLDYLSDRDNAIDIFSIPNISPIPKMKKVPRLGNIACGEPITAEQNVEGYDLIDADINCDFTLTCNGDSMINARIFDGDIVYIRQQLDVDDGEIAAVLIDNEATLKKVYKYSNKVVLRPCNPMYEDFVYTGDELNNIRILGKAIMFKSFVRHSK